MDSGASAYYPSCCSACSAPLAGGARRTRPREPPCRPPTRPTASRRSLWPSCPPRGPRPPRLSCASNGLLGHHRTRQRWPRWHASRRGAAPVSNGALARAASSAGVGGCRPTVSQASRLDLHLTAVARRRNASGESLPARASYAQAPRVASRPRRFGAGRMAAASTSATSPRTSYRGRAQCRTF